LKSSSLSNKQWIDLSDDAVNFLIERFSNECRKTKTKVIILTNHNEDKTQNEPIRNQSKNKQLALSAGKRVRASHDWFWFYA